MKNHVKFNFIILDKPYFVEFSKSVLKVDYTNFCMQRHHEKKSFKGIRDYIKIYALKSIVNIISK